MYDYYYIYISSIHITFWVNKIMGEIGAPGSNVFLGFVEADSELTQCFRSWRLETQHSELIT